MKSLQLAVCVAALLVMSGAFADQASDAGLKAKLQTRFPDIQIQAVQASSWPGLYEVITQNEIVYSDAAGERLLIGSMLDTNTHANLTDQRWNELNRIEFGSLPLDQAIKIVKGNGSRQLAIFEDPFCPFCEEIEHTLADMTDLTVYIFLYPLEDLHPGATQAAQDIWCAGDRVQAWQAWMQKRTAPKESSCKNTPLESLAELGKRLKINSTPTLFFANGYRVPGAINVDKLQKLLSQAAP